MATIFRAARRARTCFCARRFLKTHPLQAVFDFIDLQNKQSSIQPGTYSLALQYPRREFSEGQPGSLADNGISSKQEALLLIMR